TSTSRRFDPQPQRRTNEGSWLAGSCAGRGWPLAAFSPDTTGTQALGKGGSGLERGATAGQEGSWGRICGSVERGDEASQQRDLTTNWSRRRLFGDERN